MRETRVESMRDPQPREVDLDPDTLKNFTKRSGSKILYERDKGGSEEGSAAEAKDKGGDLDPTGHFLHLHPHLLRTEHHANVA